RRPPGRRTASPPRAPRRRAASGRVAVSPDLQVDAGVERVGGVGDVPDGQYLLPSGHAAEVNGVGDGGGRLPVAAVDHRDAPAPDVVLVVAGAVPGGARPGEGHRIADGRGLPALAVVVQLAEPGVAAAAAAEALRPFDALRFPPDGAAVDDALRALGLPARRRGDV